MGIKDVFSTIGNNIIDRFGTPTRAVKVNEAIIEKDKFAIATGWMFSPEIGIPRQVNTNFLLAMSQTNWVEMCIRTIIETVASMEWSIVPREGFEETYDQSRADEIRKFFEKPNKDEDFVTFLKPLLRDILATDNGVIVKTFSKGSKDESKSFNIEAKKYYVKGKNKGEVKKRFIKVFEAKPIKSKETLLTEIYSRDGNSFLMQTDIYGRLLEETPTYFQYSHFRPRAFPLAFFKREIVYFKMNPRTQSLYGWSPIESAISMIESLNAANRFNSKTFKEFAIPAMWWNFADLEDKELENIKNMFVDDIKGKPMKNIFTNFKTGTVEHDKIGLTHNDMQWLEGSKFYMKLVLALFHVNQGEVGMTDELNKHSSGAQSKIFINKAIKPIVKYVANKFSTEIMTEFYLDKKERETEFKFFIEDTEEEQRQLENAEIEIKLGTMTINEYRADKGKDPVSWGDEKFQQASPLGLQNPDQDPNKEKDPKKKSLTKAFEPIGPEDSEDYYNFLEKYYQTLENTVMKALEELDLGVLKHKKSIKKNFNEFYRRLIMVFDVEKIKARLKSVIKRTFNNGVERGEESLGFQVGFKPEFDGWVNNLTEEQINGYVLPDGKQWFGINGVNKELQNKIFDSVADGLKESESMTQLRNRVSELFVEAKNMRSLRIARTEATRILNQGTIQAFKSSGVSGQKEWIATMDERTCPWCRALDGKKVGLSETFESDGMALDHPPRHPNCRCSVIMLPGDE